MEIKKEGNEFVKVEIDKYPEECILCDGKNNIAIKDILELKCPACFYDDWLIAPQITLILTKEEADRLKVGRPAKLTLEPLQSWAEKKKPDTRIRRTKEEREKIEKERIKKRKEKNKLKPKKKTKKMIAKEMEAKQKKAKENDNKPE
jgi:hypothetical protein